jgi:hypothetical protein
MGWWKIDDKNVVGDGPLDTLGDALSMVKEEYAAQFGRKPTKEEWERLLSLALGHEEPEYRVLDDGVVTAVRLEVTPD